MGIVSQLAEQLIEQHIAAGRLAPAARDMASPQQVARQYNEANALGPDDPDFMVTPEAAQSAARLALRLADHQIPVDSVIALTDAVPGYEPSDGTYAVQPSQVEFALEHLRAVTGDCLPASDLVIAALPWEYDLDDADDGAA